MSWPQLIFGNGKICWSTKLVAIPSIGPFRPLKRLWSTLAHHAYHLAKRRFKPKKSLPNELDLTSDLAGDDDGLGDVADFAVFVHGGLSQEFVGFWFADTALLYQYAFGPINELSLFEG